jgi:hypothetical protein
MKRIIDIVFKTKDKQTKVVANEKPKPRISHTVMPKNRRALAQDFPVNCVQL